MAQRNIKYQNQNFIISYEFHNLDKEKNIIFLHGWGSSKAIMKNIFVNSLHNYRHIYIDLIGFGKSGDAKFSLNSFDYKEILEIFFAELEISKDIIFGHSFGGKIATLLNPEKLVLLSSAGILIEKSFSVKSKIFLHQIFKRIGFSFLRNIFISKDGQNLSENMYKTFKNIVDENFEHIFKNREKETLIFWGIEDKATPLLSGEKIHSLIKDSKFFPLNGNHFFFIKNIDFISNKI